MFMNNLSLKNSGLLSGVLILGLVFITETFGQETTVLVVSDSSGAVEQYFIGAACPNKSMGASGCLKMSKGKKNRHFNFFFSDETAAANWKWVRIQIREPFKDWGDMVDPNILNDLKVIGGGAPFFSSTGEATFSNANKDKFKMMDKNNHEFLIQYRIEVTDGVTTEWVHPVLENEG